MKLEGVAVDEEERITDPELLAEVMLRFQFELVIKTCEIGLWIGFDAGHGIKGRC